MELSVAAGQRIDPLFNSRADIDDVFGGRVGHGLEIVSARPDQGLVGRRRTNWLYGLDHRVTVVGAVAARRGGGGIGRRCDGLLDDVVVA